MNIKNKICNPDTHYKIMDLIQKKPHITQRELASKMSISLGSIHYCLKALASKGLLKAVNFKNNNNKLMYLYILTPKGIAKKSMLAFGFLNRKKLEYDQLRKEIDALTEEIYS